MSAEILLFGDSIAHGIFQGEEWLSWGDLLKKKLQSDPNNRLFNLSIPGDDTVWVLHRMDMEAASRGRDIILFAVGINDTKSFGGRGNQIVPIPEFASNVQAILEKAKRYTSRLVWIGLTPITDELTRYMQRMGYGYFYEQKIIEEYNATLKSICLENGVEYISMENCLSSEDLFDGLHPNSHGQEKMFERIYNHISEYI